MVSFGRKRDPVFDPDKPDNLVRRDPVLEPDPVRVMGGPAGIVTDPEKLLIPRIERIIDTRLNRMMTGADVYMVEAARLKKAGKPLAAGLQVSAYTATRAAMGAIEGLTLPFRPIAIMETGQALAGLATSAKKRTEYMRGVAADPLGFLAGVAGGYLGATVSPLKFSIKRKTTAKTPEITTPASLQARGTWPKSGQGGFGKSRGSVVILQKPQLRDLPRAPAYVNPLALTISTGIGLRHKVTTSPSKTIPRTVSRPQPVQMWADPVTRLLPRVRQEPRLSGPVKDMERRIVVPPIPLIRPTVIPTVYPPGYTPRPVQATALRSLTMPRLAMMQEPIAQQKQRQRTITVPIPQMRHVSLTDPLPALRRPRRKKKGYDPLSLDIWGEMRSYPVKTPKNVLKSLGLRL